jgi:hypothetical protein
VLQIGKWEMGKAKHLSAPLCIIKEKEMNKGVEEMKK